MKQISLLLILLVAMSLSVTAIYDPNGTHTNSSDDGPQILKSSGPPAYQVNLKQEKPACGTSDAGNVSINTVNVSADGADLNLEGVFQTPNPCHALNRELKKVGEQHYVLNITDQQMAETCAECIGNINYEVNLTVPEDGSLFEVHHNGEKMVEEQIPEAENTTEDSSERSNEEESKGIIRSILEAFRGLF